MTGARPEGAPPDPGPKGHGGIAPLLVVDVAQLEERRDVAPEVTGSIPVIHPLVNQRQARPKRPRR